MYFRIKRYYEKIILKKKGLGLISLSFIVCIEDLFIDVEKIFGDFLGYSTDIGERFCFRVILRFILFFFGDREFWSVFLIGE